MLRRMAEIRERKALSEVLRAKSVLSAKEQDRVDWVESQIARDASFLEGAESLTGAVLGMLNETRKVSVKRVQKMDEEIDNINGVLLTRQQEHQATLHRVNGATKVEDHVRIQYSIEMEYRWAVELEDTANAVRLSRAPDQES